MIKNNKPFCDECGMEMVALSEEDALADIIGHGWTDWKTAHKHYCHVCQESICREVNYPPCDECRTQPCERGGECWASPPIHIFPYETYIADKLERMRLAKEQRTLEVAVH